MKRALFLADAGPAAGLGHLQRCLSLAGGMRGRGIRTAFLAGADPSVQSRVAGQGHEAVAIDAGADGASQAERAAAVCAQGGFDAAVVDSYRVGARDLERLRQAGPMLISIDDLAREALPSHIVINGGAHASRLEYRSSSGDTRFLLGPDYAMLRPEFSGPRPRPQAATVRNILVTLGGGDAFNLMPRILELLGRLPGAFSITAILGPFFTRQKDLEAPARASRRPVRLVQAPESVAGLMSEADLAVSAGGQTLYELAATGCPAIAISVAENQDVPLAALEDAGCVRVAGRMADGDVLMRLQGLLRALIGDAESRFAMSMAGQRLVDGNGVARVLEALWQGSAAAAARNGATP
jgi:UDP-2,4-diacetamido-2,4,6-trideoxy-beta-L-altropyranose hydrolase